MMEDLSAAAFLSYAHADDVDDQVTRFGRRLAAEIRVQLGRPVPVFQDRRDIGWGEAWRDRIEQSLTETTFLVPILTPSFFASLECRREFERFVEREQALGRRDLILPIYYVTHLPLEAETEPRDDLVLATVRARQRIDWRALRFESFSDPKVARMFARLGRDVRDALQRPASKPDVARTKAGTPTGEVERGGGKRSSVPPVSPPTVTVDALGRGDFSSIRDAIKSANPGDRILVRAGLYAEAVFVDRPLEIVGDGDRGEVVIQYEGDAPLRFRTTMGRIANLSIRKLAGHEHYAVSISQGRLDLEDCDVSSEALAGIGVFGGADCRIRRCRIHDTGQGGIFLYDNARGTVEHNEITAFTLSGIEVTKGAQCSIRHNFIHDGAQSAVYVHSGGRAEIENNELVDNGEHGVEVHEGGHAAVRGNQIHRNEDAGVFFAPQGAGAVDGNELLDNGRALDIDPTADVRLGTNTLPAGDEASESGGAADSAG